MKILLYMHSSISKFSWQNPNKIQSKSQNKKIIEYAEEGPIYPPSAININNLSISTHN